MLSNEEDDEEIIDISYQPAYSYSNNEEMKITFKVLSNVYGPPNELGESKLIKKNVESRLTVDIRQIEYVEEYIDQKGNVSKSTCLIKLGGESIRVKYNFDKLNKLKENTINKPNPVGFKYKRKR